MTRSKKRRQVAALQSSPQRSKPFVSISVHSWLNFRLFVAKRFDGIERGGFARGIEAEEDANGCAEQECNSNRPDRNQRGPMRINRQDTGRADAADDSDDAADGAQRHR